jgi:ABC-type cobalamin transport system permease subunit
MSIQNLNEPEKVWQLTVTRVLAYIILFVPSTLSGLFLISLTEDQFAENSVPGMSYMAAVFLVVAVQRFMHEGS